MIYRMRRENERALLEGIVRRLSAENMRHMIEDGMHNNLIKEGAKVQKSANNIVDSAHKGNKEEVDANAMPLAENVCDFEKTVKDYAATMKSDTDQKTILSNLGQVLMNTKNLLECSQKLGENPKSEPLTRDLNYASQALNTSLNATLLSVIIKARQNSQKISTLYSLQT